MRPCAHATLECHKSLGQCDRGPVAQRVVLQGPGVTRLCEACLPMWGVGVLPLLP